MAKKFEWTPKYSVNIKEIDEQHKEFIKICNSLLDLAERKTFTKEEALLKSSKLGNYAAYHLGTEEEYFIETKYPNTIAHVKAHDHFRENAMYFVNQIKEKNTDLEKIANEMATFAAEWLLNHILIEDKKYSKFFNEHGIK